MNCSVVVGAMQCHKLKILLKTSQSGEMPCSRGLHSLAVMCNNKPKHDTSSGLSLPSAGDKDTFPPPLLCSFSPTRHDLLCNLGLSGGSAHCKHQFYGPLVHRGTNTFPVTCSLIQGSTLILDCREISA